MTRSHRRGCEAPIALRRSGSLIRRLLRTLGCALIFAAPAISTRAADLADLDLATLMSMDVTLTSASRREQEIANTAGAVYVITRDEIERSGATHIPQVLRLAPGIHVARIDTRSWAVTTRGFNNLFATKLLVMVDGRSIYMPSFSGVIWEEQSLSLDEIERIEIVRGPGGAVWGINAVNGVINIITRRANPADGLQMRAGAGTTENGSAAVSYSGTAGIGTYRAYAEASEFESLEKADASYKRSQAGLRLERPFSGGELAVAADFNSSDFGDVPPYPEATLAMATRSGRLTGSWHRDVSSGELQIATHYTYVERGSPIEWDEEVFGFDTQFSAERIGRHLFTAGAGFQYTQDSLDDASLRMALTPAREKQQQWNVYGQDEIRFFDDEVRVIAGAKLEHLKFSGLAFQPTLRALWQVTDRQSVWAAASRAVRTPSRSELHSVMTLGQQTPYGTVLLRAVGDPKLNAEDLHAYEVGWRWRPYRTLSFDVAAYRHRYEHLISASPLPPFVESEPAPALVLPAVFANMEGNVYVDGLEVVAEWAPMDWLYVQAQGSFQDSGYTFGGFQPGVIDPERMLTLRSQIDLPHDLELDASWRSVSELPGQGVAAYETLDARIAWHANAALEISFGGENLLNDRHNEFGDPMSLLPGTWIGRSVYARFVWRPGLSR